MSAVFGHRTLTKFFSIDYSEEGKTEAQIYVDRDTNLAIFVYGTGAGFKVEMELSPGVDSGLFF
jgi:hypothetical protein